MGGDYAPTFILKLVIKEKRYLVFFKGGNRVNFTCDVRNFFYRRISANNFLNKHFSTLNEILITDSGKSYPCLLKLFNVLTLNN